MAERRMFAKTIVDSDAFLDMPSSARLLYFDFGIRADDDGFLNNPKKVQRMTGASDDDLKLLIAKKFIIPFDSGVVVIKHWRIHNYIQPDRYTETKYKEEKAALLLDENNAYSLNNGIPIQCKIRKPKELTDAQQKRFDAKKESDLPYSFEYKIRNAFVNEECPICHCIMNYSNNLTKPTIQHNIPISLGGKHEIDNISVICQSCNTSIKNKVATEPFNTDKVKAIWACIGNVSIPETQVRLGKVSIGKDRIEDIESVHPSDDGTAAPITKPRKKFVKPSLQEVSEYCTERKNTVSPEKFLDYYEANGWRVGRNPMKDWRAAVRTWEKNEAAFAPKAARDFEKEDAERRKRTIEKVMKEIGENGR